MISLVEKNSGMSSNSSRLNDKYRKEARDMLNVKESNKKLNSLNDENRYPLPQLQAIPATKFNKYIAQNTRNYGKDQFYPEGFVNKALPIEDFLSRSRSPGSQDQRANSKENKNFININGYNINNQDHKTIQSKNNNNNHAKQTRTFVLNSENKTNTIPGVPIGPYTQTRHKTVVAVNGKLYYDSNKSDADLQQDNSIRLDNADQSFLNLSTYSYLKNGGTNKNLEIYSKMNGPNRSSPSEHITHPKIPESHTTTKISEKVNFVQNLHSQSNNYASDCSQNSIVEFRVNPSFLDNGREICGYIHDEIGEFQSIQNLDQSQNSNRFNKQNDKIGRKYNYLMIDGEMVVNEHGYCQPQKTTKILISVGPGDKRKAEQFLKSGAILGYIDKKTKLFVPRSINKEGAVFSRSRSSSKLEKMNKKKGTREGRGALLEIKKSKLNESSPVLQPLERSKDIIKSNNGPVGNYEQKRRSVVKKDNNDSKPDFIIGTEEQEQRRDRYQEYAEKSRERIEQYKNKLGTGHNFKDHGSINNLAREASNDLYSKVDRANHEQIHREGINIRDHYSIERRRSNGGYIPQDNRSLSRDSENLGIKSLLKSDLSEKTNMYKHSSTQYNLVSSELDRKHKIQNSDAYDRSKSRIKQNLTNSNYSQTKNNNSVVTGTNPSQLTASSNKKPYTVGRFLPQNLSEATHKQYGYSRPLSKSPDTNYNRYDYDQDRKEYPRNPKDVLNRNIDSGFKIDTTGSKATKDLSSYEVISRSTSKEKKHKEKTRNLIMSPGPLKFSEMGIQTSDRLKKVKKQSDEAPHHDINYVDQATQMSHRYDSLKANDDYLDTFKGIKPAVQKYTIFHSEESRHFDPSPMDKYITINNHKHFAVVNENQQQSKFQKKKPPGFNTSRCTVELMMPMTDRNFVSKTSTDSKNGELNLSEIDNIDIMPKLNLANKNMGKSILDKFLVVPSERKMDLQNQKESVKNSARSRSGSFRKIDNFKVPPIDYKLTSEIQNLKTSLVQNSVIKTTFPDEDRRFSSQIKSRLSPKSIRHIYGSPNTPILIKDSADKRNRASKHTIEPQIVQSIQNSPYDFEQKEQIYSNGLNKMKTQIISPSNQRRLMKKNRVHSKSKSRSRNSSISGSYSPTGSRDEGMGLLTTIRHMKNSQTSQDRIKKSTGYQNYQQEQLDSYPGLNIQSANQIMPIPNNDQQLQNLQTPFYQLEANNNINHINVTNSTQMQKPRHTKVVIRADSPANYQQQDLTKFMASQQLCNPNIYSDFQRNSQINPQPLEKEEILNKSLTRICAPIEILYSPGRKSDGPTSPPQTSRFNNPTLIKSQPMDSYGISSDIQKSVIPTGYPLNSFNPPIVQKYLIQNQVQQIYSSPIQDKQPNLVNNFNPADFTNNHSNYVNNLTEQSGIRTPQHLPMVSPIEKNGDFYVSGMDSILSFNVEDRRQYAQNLNSVNTNSSQHNKQVYPIQQNPTQTQLAPTLQHISQNHQQYQIHHDNQTGHLSLFQNSNNHPSEACKVLDQKQSRPSKGMRKKPSNSSNIERFYNVSNYGSSQNGDDMRLEEIQIDLLKKTRTGR